MYGQHESNGKMLFPEQMGMGNGPEKLKARKVASEVQDNRTFIPYPFW